MVLKEGALIAEHYVLIKQLGHGSFGNVWLAHNELADIHVAIKFYAALDSAGLEEFRQEYKVAYKLNHPNILNINHFDVFEHCPYLIMPYCANGSLAKHVGKLREAEIWKVATDVASGLEFLHSQLPPIIHQDIKPDNILITDDGRNVITDFGISHNLHTRMSMSMNASNSSGTLAYMGPEHFGQQPCSVMASDIWALGMTLYELVTGTVLWEGMGGCAQLNGAQIPPIEGKVSRELAMLITDCLAKDTWNRPNAKQIQQRYEAYLNKDYQPQQTYASSYNNNHAQNSYQQNSNLQNNNHQNSNYHYTPHTPSSNKNNKKKYAILAAAAIAAVLLLTGVVYFVRDINENQDFLRCRTPQQFEQFIIDHPNSKYVEKAQKRIMMMTGHHSDDEHTTETNTATERPHTSQTATQAAPQTVTQTTIQTIEQPEHKTVYQRSENGKPNGKVKHEAEEAADDGTTRVSRPNTKDDDRIFYECSTAADYQYYLYNFPHGKHVKEAKQVLDNLRNYDNKAGVGETAEGTNPENGQQQPPTPKKDKNTTISVGIDPVRVYHHFRRK